MGRVEARFREVGLIAALVLFPVVEGTTLEQMKQAFEQSAPQFAGMAGLIRKFYLFNGSKEGGAFYVWASREQAEAFYNDDWRQNLAQRYGAPPRLAIYEIPVSIDNEKQ